jgi:hypothetical protein
MTRDELQVELQNEIFRESLRTDNISDFFRENGIDDCTTCDRKVVCRTPLNILEIDSGRIVRDSPVTIIFDWIHEITICAPIVGYTSISIESRDRTNSWIKLESDVTNPTTRGDPNCQR